jgi:hypothetical protein
MKQLLLINDRLSLEYGGSLLRGRRKSRRPLDKKRSVHLVLKASDTMRLICQTHLIKSTINKYSKRFAVKVYSIAVHCDHIHIHLKIFSRATYNRWIRTITSRLVALIDGLRWSLRPYSRVVDWGKPFFRVKAYLEYNQQEAHFIKNAHFSIKLWLNEHWQGLDLLSQ